MMHAECYTGAAWFIFFLFILHLAVSKTLQANAVENTSVGSSAINNYRHPGFGIHQGYESRDFLDALIDKVSRHENWSVINARDTPHL